MDTTRKLSNLALILTGFALLEFSASRPAVAQTVEVTASGVVSSLSPSPGAFDSSVSVGTSFSMNFFYQLGVPNSFTDPTLGAYDYSGSSYGVAGTFGDYTISRNAGTSDIAVFNRPSGFSYYEVGLSSFGSTLTSTNPQAGSLPGQTQFSLDFRDNTGAVADSNSLPRASLYQLSNFTGDQSSVQFNIFYEPGPNQQGELLGTITSFSAQTFPPAVPEASTTVSFGLLLVLGMGGMVIAAKRKKTNIEKASTTV